MPAWGYDAPLTLSFGGAWVTAGGNEADVSRAGREPTSADLTIALDGVVIDSGEVALSPHPGRVGVYNLVFAAAYWDRPSARMGPTVFFAEGTFASPTHGTFGAFSDRLALLDCKMPVVARAMIMQKSFYECTVGTGACPADGLRDAAFVLDVVFSEPVLRAGGGSVTEADVEIYIVGGGATVMDTYVVVRSSSVTQTDGTTRRLQESAVQRLSFAVKLSAGATGFEVVKVKPLPGAITDSSGSWAVSASVDEDINAIGSVLEPLSPQDDINFESINAPTLITVGCLVFVLILCGIALRFWKEHKYRLSMDRVAPRPMNFNKPGGPTKPNQGGAKKLKVKAGANPKFTPTRKPPALVDSVDSSKGLQNPKLTPTRKPPTLSESADSVKGLNPKPHPSAKLDPIEQPPAVRDLATISLPPSPVVGQQLYPPSLAPIAVHNLATTPLPLSRMRRASSSVATNIGGFFIYRPSTAGSQSSPEELAQLARCDSPGRIGTHNRAVALFA